MEDSSNIICIEGLDRTAKTTVANWYVSQGYEVVHFGPPDKKYLQDNYAGPSYLDDLVDMFLKFAHRKICLDRSCFGELIWPQIYGRKALLDEEDITVLKEILDSYGCEYLLMFDADKESHWKRCEENKEPLTRAQFYKAASLYDSMAKTYGFKRKQMSDFNLLPEKETKVVSAPKKAKEPEQKAPASVLKLEKANAINGVLSKRIIKKSGPIYDAIEADVRAYLSNKLSSLLGEEVKAAAEAFSMSEIQILKIYCKKLIEKTVINDRR